FHLLPIKYRNLHSAIPSVEEIAVHGTNGVTIECQHISSPRMVGAEVLDCIAIGTAIDAVPLESLAAQVTAPHMICTRHICQNQSLNRKVEIGLDPVLPKSLADCPNNAITDPRPDWRRIEFYPHRNHLLIPFYRIRAEKSSVIIRKK
ncbi:MAG: hypothetical protein MJZ22_05610, partial [Candidatus Saccharibacteria bacterium]|nr:hypothetical protein [Candidatus Saccharibacteria bacterium]